MMACRMGIARICRIESFLPRFHQPQDCGRMARERDCMPWVGEAAHTVRFFAKIRCHRSASGPLQWRVLHTPDLQNSSDAVIDALPLLQESENEVILVVHFHLVKTR